MYKCISGPVQECDRARAAAEEADAHLRHVVRANWPPPGERLNAAELRWNAAGISGRPRYMALYSYEKDTEWACMYICCRMRPPDAGWLHFCNRHRRREKVYLKQLPSVRHIHMHMPYRRPSGVTKMCFSTSDSCFQALSRSVPAFFTPLKAIVRRLSARGRP